jgi:hypothetical protein
MRVMNRLSCDADFFEQAQDGVLHVHQKVMTTARSSMFACMTCQYMLHIDDPPTFLRVP